MQPTTGAEGSAKHLAGVIHPDNHLPAAMQINTEIPLQLFHQGLLPFPGWCGNPSVPRTLGYRRREEPWRFTTDLATKKRPRTAGRPSPHHRTGSRRSGAALLHDINYRTASSQRPKRFDLVRVSTEQTLPNTRRNLGSAAVEGHVGLVEGDPRTVRRERRMCGVVEVGRRPV